jgi:predicted double-glycine peptidase
MRHCMLLCGALLLGASGVGAGVAHAADLPALGGAYYSVPVKSIKEVRRASTMLQQYDFSCGSAALATLLTHHYDYPANERAIFEDMYTRGDQQKIRKEGFSLLDMKNFLEARGFHADGFQQPLEKLAEAGIPAIVLISENGYNHFVVVKGLRGDRILLGDPASGTGTLNSAGGLISVSDISSTLSLGTTGSIIFTGTGTIGSTGSPLVFTQTPVNVQTVNPISLTFASPAQPSGLIFAAGSSVSAFLGGAGSAVTLAANASQLLANATVSSVQGTAAAAVAEASKVGFDTDSVAQQINYGFAGDVGVSPPMNHTIDETGVSVPEGFGEEEDEPPPAKKNYGPTSCRIGFGRRSRLGRVRVSGPGIDYGSMVAFGGFPAIRAPSGGIAVTWP